MPKPFCRALGTFCALGWLCAACSCVPEPVLDEIFSADAVPPEFLGCVPVERDILEFHFSEPVRLASIRMAPGVGIADISEGPVLSVRTSGPLVEGAPYTADLLVEDERGNTLNVLVPFRARNRRMPRLRITEVRTEYSKPKVEFVEFRTESSGQLGALRLFSGDDGFAEPLFEFPLTEVEEGEYVVLHLRTLEAACLDETGSDLAASGGTDATPGARDFWLPGAEKRIRKTDALALTDQDGVFLDAVLLSETPEGAWKKEELALCAAALAAAEAWRSAADSGVPTPADAASSAGTTATRTICRDEALEDGNRAGDWYVTATSCATPGGPNSTERYEPPL